MWFHKGSMLTGITAALLAKFKPAGAEKPVIRPYTPTNDEGKSSHSAFAWNLN